MLSSFAFVFCLCFGHTLLQEKSLAQKKNLNVSLTANSLVQTTLLTLQCVLIKVYAIRILNIKSFLNELKCVNIVLINSTCCASHSWH